MEYFTHWLAATNQNYHLLFYMIIAIRMRNKASPSWCSKLEGWDPATLSPVQISFLFPQSRFVPGRLERLELLEVIFSCLVELLYLSHLTYQMTFDTFTVVQKINLSKSPLIFMFYFDTLEALQAQDVARSVLATWRHKANQVKEKIRSLFGRPNKSRCFDTKTSKN